MCNLNLQKDPLWKILLQCSVLKGDLYCQGILSIFPARVHLFYANTHVFININPFLYTNNQFALIDVQKLSKRKHSNLDQQDFHHRNDVGCNEASGGNVLIELAVFGEKILLF